MKFTAASEAIPSFGRVHQGPFLSQIRVSGASPYVVATPRPLNASLPFRCNDQPRAITKFLSNSTVQYSTAQHSTVAGSEQEGAPGRPRS
eukprot:1196274-Prorocentrum_minimum.AAC.5